MEPLSPATAARLCGAYCRERARLLAWLTAAQASVPAAGRTGA
jgi:hypothetical protein